MAVEALEAVARNALYAYDVENIRLSAPALGNNAVFRVECDQGTFALRLHRAGYREPSQIRSELTYLEGLGEQTDVSAPRPVRTREGDLVCLARADGLSRHCTLLSWFDGQVRRPGDGAGAATLSRIGRTLGQIHRFYEVFTPPPGFELPSWKAAADLTSSRSPLKPGLLGELATREQRLLAEVASRLAPVFDWLDGQDNQHGVIHKDFILKNCLHRGRATHVIDFDDCGFGYYLSDLGGLLSNLQDYPSYRSLLAPFLAGYRDVRPLPEEMERHFDLMVAARHATSALWILGRWRVGDVGDRYFRRLLRYRMGALAAMLKRI